MTDTAGRIYLVDSHALIYQMFHAIRDQMNAPDGRPTNAVFGVTRDLLYLHSEVKPDYLLCAFDLAEPTFRDAIEPTYKKNRPPQPQDLGVQVPMIQEVLTAMNLPILAVPGYEADDVMATVSVEGEKRGLDVYLCTSDKDCRQLITDRVRIYSLRKREEMNREKLVADWGVTPEQVVDFQSLVGDSVDNIKGVPGIGEKTAAKLLQQYGTLDNIIAHAGEIPQKKMRENLLASIENGVLEKARKLVKLRTDVPMNIDWDDWRRREWNGEKLLETFQAFGFRRFADQVRSTLKASGAKKNDALVASLGETNVPKNNGIQANLFSEVEFEFGANAAPDPWGADWS